MRGSVYILHQQKKYTQNKQQEESLGEDKDFLRENFSHIQQKKVILIST